MGEKEGGGWMGGWVEAAESGWGGREHGSNLMTTLHMADG